MIISRIAKNDAIKCNKIHTNRMEVRERFELSTSGFAGLRTTGLYYLTAVKKTQN